VSVGGEALLGLPCLLRCERERLVDGRAMVSPAGAICRHGRTCWRWQAAVCRR
jgi:hypothetical protein